jgi:hypothetical protein
MVLALIPQRRKTHVHGPACADRIVTTTQRAFEVPGDAITLNRRHNSIGIILDRKYLSSLHVPIHITFLYVL